MTKSKILLTGFMPFGQHQHNPTQELCRRLHQQEVEGAVIEAHVLPVDWWPARLQLSELLAQSQDQDCLRAVLLTGLAASRPYLSLERQAKNLRLNRSGLHAEQTDQTEVMEPIELTGPENMQTSVDLARPLIEHLKDTWHDNIQISDDAGTYLCNFVYYLTLRQLKGTVPCLFVHVPENPDMIALSSTIKRLVALIKA